MIANSTLDTFDNNEYQKYCSAAQLEKDLNILRGILFGITADKVVNKNEISLVKDWIDAAREYERYFPYKVFIKNLQKVIADNIITEEESKDLLWLCDQYLNKDNPYYNIITTATQTLTGILNGITADGIINEYEINFLNKWMDDNIFLRNTWLFDEIFMTVKEALFHREITTEITNKLNKLSLMVGSDIGDADNSALIESIKLDTNETSIVLVDKAFCITGNSLYNTRREIAEMIEAKGGKVQDKVTSKLDYLIICDEKNTCWAFASYGRKVEKALQIQKKSNSKIKIIYEIDLYKHLES